MKIEGKFILKVAGTLTAISLVVAALLGFTNQLTYPNIAATNAAKTEASLQAVATADEFKPMDVTDELFAAGKTQGGKVTEAYEVIVGGENAGYAFKVVASGSQGDIEMIVGVDADLAVTGVSIVKNAETSGIGSKVMSNMATAKGVGVLDQFIGMSGAGSIAVGANVDAISGATVSSKGVTKGVNTALAAAEVIG